MHWNIKQCMKGKSFTRDEEEPAEQPVFRILATSNAESVPGGFFETVSTSQPQIQKLPEFSYYQLTLVRYP